VSIRVLVVDDSAFMRHALVRRLDVADGIEVVGSAANGELALGLVATLHPDVITLDVEMPVLGGLAMLQRLMVERPTRVVMVSSRTTAGAQVTLEALAAGAIDFVAKPDGASSIHIGRMGDDLVARIRAAAGMSETSWAAHRGRAARAIASATARDAAGPMASAIANAPAAPQAQPASRPGPTVTARKLVVIAASTGGPTALQVVVGSLPAGLDAAVLIVQHMPAGFTASLAKRLDGSGPLAVREAAADDRIGAAEVLVAPGERHLISSLSGRVQLVGLPAVNGVRPAADVTFQAVAPIWRERLLAVVLTGMGHDGRDGVRAVRSHGGTVVAQDEATSTIWGMPGAVVEAGLAQYVLGLEQIGPAIAAWVAGSRQIMSRSRAIPDTAAAAHP